MILYEVKENVENEMTKEGKYDTGTTRINACRNSFSTPLFVYLIALARKMSIAGSTYVFCNSTSTHNFTLN